MLHLREYQSLLIEGTRQEFLQGHRRTCIVAPCGAGKTVIMTWMAAQSATRGQQVLFAVHRQELIDQSSDTFKEQGINHGIIAAGYPMTNNRIQLGMIQTVARRLKKIEPPNLIIIDECFPAGTIINNKPIEQLKIGDTVPCFDENTKQIKHSIVTHIFKKQAPSILIKLIVSGRKIICTENHPIFTTNGWVEAKNIKEGDLTYVYMPSLRWANEKRKSTKMSKMLQRRYGSKKQKRFFRKNEKSQSNEKTGDKRKGVSVSTKNETQTIGKRWKWHGSNSTSINDVGRIRMDRYRVYIPNRSEGNGNTQSLQNRHSKSEVENSHRNRRIFALRISQTKTRQKERRFLKVARVDSVKIYEQASDGGFSSLCSDGYVYNIEVAGYNTYFANGLAVHNCHHILAKTYLKVIEAFPNAYVIGLTATPARMGGQGLGDVFQSLILGPSVKQLIEWGNLSPFKYYAPPVKADLSGLRVKYGDYVKSEVALEMDRSEIIGDSIEQYCKLCPGKRAICYCAGVAHSEHTAQMFQAAGIMARHIDGETPKETRKQIIEQFRTGEVKVLCNVDLISEGFDVPTMEAVMLLRPTQSLTLHIQQSMRAMRYDEDNPNKTAIIIDHVGNVYRHGLPDEDRVWTLESRKKQKQVREVKIRECPKCYGAHNPAPVCPYCGHVYEVAQREGPEQKKGELTEIKELQRKLERQEVGKARSVKRLEEIAIERGYKLGWIKRMAEIKGIRG